MNLTWKRARKQKTEVSEWTIWEAKEGLWRVVKRDSFFEQLTTPHTAMFGRMRTISEHKTKAAAVRACERDARRK